MTFFRMTQCKIQRLWSDDGPESCCSAHFSPQEVASTAACLAGPPQEAVQEAEAEHEAEIEEERAALRSMTATRCVSHPPGLVVPRSQRTPTCLHACQQILSD